MQMSDQGQHMTWRQYNKGICFILLSHILQLQEVESNSVHHENSFALVMVQHKEIHYLHLNTSLLRPQLFTPISEDSSETLTKQRLKVENTAFQCIRQAMHILNIKYKQAHHKGFVPASPLVESLNGRAVIRPGEPWALISCSQGASSSGYPSCTKCVFIMQITTAHLSNNNK